MGRRGSSDRLEALSLEIERKLQKALVSNSQRLQILQQLFADIALKVDDRARDAIMSENDDGIAPVDEREDGWLCFYEILANHFVRVPESGRRILELIVQLWSQSFASNIFALLFHKWLFEAPLDEKEISLRYSSALVQGATNVFWIDIQTNTRHFLSLYHYLLEDVALIPDRLTKISLQAGRDLFLVLSRFMFFYDQDHLLSSFLEHSPTFPNSFLVGGPADYFVIELTDQLQKLKIEPVLLHYLSRMSILQGLELRLSTSTRLKACLYSFTSPGGPTYPTRAVRHAAWNTLDLLFPLSGEIPESIGKCTVLEELGLDNNLFNGNIPQYLNKALTMLNLSVNELSGSIPDALGSISGLEQLYLAHNNLSGPIPPVLQNLTSLWMLDLSFNNLQGEVPKEGIFRNVANMSITGNNKLCGGIPQLHLVPCKTDSAKKNRRGNSKYLKIALATSFALLLLAIVIALLIYRKKKGKLKCAYEPSMVDEQYERVSYHALSNGTNGFSEDNLLGKGSFGTVYKCAFQPEGTVVAVKVFDLQQSGSTKSFVAECEALRRVRHRCLMKIITCCSSINEQGQDFKALVFEFMPNGSLNRWLHIESGMPTMNNTLSLAQRLDIAVDIMDALDYLHNHCQPPIIHCDLKPSNILLAEDMSARVGDFGISRIISESESKIMQNSNSTIGIKGSIGYVAPEYGEGSSITTSGDVYSLGILLLEIFTGRSPTDDMFRDSVDLLKFSEDAPPDKIWEIADKTMWLHSGTYDSNTRNIIEKCLVHVIALGVSCSRKQPRERILIQDAVNEMHAIRDSYLKFARALVVEDEAGMILQ